jgi:predicted TPR repeat methyltransferase
MSKKTNLDMKFTLWERRPIKEILETYANSSISYDDDLTKAGYETPRRIAAVLAEFANLDSRILDFGCGTRLSC